MPAVPINTICPHCESRFNDLQEALLGKTLKCPACKEFFTVARAPAHARLSEPIAPPPALPTGKASKLRSDDPAPKYQSGALGDFVDVLPSEPIPLLPDSAPQDEEAPFADFEVVEEPARVADK